MDVARFIAGVTGYHVDIEPLEPGKVRITAEGVGAKHIANGITADAAALKLLKLLTKGRQ